MRIDKSRKDKSIKAGQQKRLKRKYQRFMAKSYKENDTGILKGEMLSGQDLEKEKLKIREE